MTGWLQRSPRLLLLLLKTLRPFLIPTSSRTVLIVSNHTPNGLLGKTVLCILKYQPRKSARLCQDICIDYIVCTVWSVSNLLTCVDHNSYLKEQCSLASFRTWRRDSYTTRRTQFSNPQLAQKTRRLVFTRLFSLRYAFRPSSQSHWLMSRCLGGTCLHLFPSHWHVCQSQTVFAWELLEATWGICRGSVWDQWRALGGDPQSSYVASWQWWRRWYW